MRKTLTDAERDRAMDLLDAEVARNGKADIARRLSVSPTAISLVARGKYVASPDRVLIKVLAALDRHACPYLGTEVESTYCNEINAGLAPTWNPSALTQRRICQTCQHKPIQEIAA